ncbi:MAG TPA: Amuc_1100 family pilus-like protein [Verrucomicrobiae bacterium]|jgi:hypothetical protein|nr:Amuc_1100 family pilus-like protein [Verrucomicrobiae bacterium]
MSWVKRNLYFLIGSLVALVLMGAGGFYLYSNISNEAKVTTDIETQYAELKRLAGQNPHPGDKGKIDNVEAARDQEKALRAFIAKTTTHFKRPTPIPDSPRVGGAEFATQLPNVIAQLNREATNASVGLPENYYFSFEAQKRLVTFDPASLNKLAVSLGEIRALSEILFDAKINYLDAIKREVISPTNDVNMGDYISLTTTSNALAELTPYEIDFRGFSAELAAVLSGLVNSPYCIIVKSMNIEPAPATEQTEPGSAPPPPRQIYIPPPQNTMSQDAANYMAQRYGTGGGRPTYRPPPPVAQIPNPAAAPPKAAAFISEHQLRVTLEVAIVKLKETKGK